MAPRSSTAACSAGSWRTRCPPDAPGKYFMAQMRGENVAAVGSQMDGAAPAAWNTYIWVESADDTAAKVREAGGSVLSEPMTSSTRAGWRSSPTRRAQRSASGRPASTAAPTIVNEPGSVELQRPPHPRPRGREGVLRRGVRLGGAHRHGACGRSRLRRPPRAAQPRHARADEGVRRRRSASRRWSPPST